MFSLLCYGEIKMCITVTQIKVLQKSEKVCAPRVILVVISRVAYYSGFQTGVRGPKGVRDGFPGGPREDSEE